MPTLFDDMDDAEKIEKIRQSVMRYRELLDLSTPHLADSEKKYAALFLDIPQDLRESLPEKSLQREAALRALPNLEPLQRAILRTHFDLHEMTRAFEELYGHIAPAE